MSDENGKISRKDVKEILRKHIEKNKNKSEEDQDSSILITIKEKNVPDGKVEEVMILSTGLSRREAIGLLETAKLKILLDEQLPSDMGMLKQLKNRLFHDPSIA